MAKRSLLGNPMGWHRTINRFTAFIFSCGILVSFGRVVVAGPPALLSDALPPVFGKLYTWPTTETLARHDVRERVLFGSHPQYDSTNWLIKLIDKQWLPPATAKCYFLMKEFDNTDVIRIAWATNGVTFEFSQTRGALLLKLHRQSGAGFDREKDVSLDRARAFLLGILNKRGDRWGIDNVTHLPVRVEIENFAAELERRLFGPEAPVKHTQDGYVICRCKEVPTNIGIWHEHVTWWYSGEDAGVFCLKFDGLGSTFLRYDASQDEQWFYTTNATPPSVK